MGEMWLYIYITVLCFMNTLKFCFVTFQNIFGCRLRELGPFKKCCDRNLFGLTAVESSQKETTGLHVETDDREVLTYASKNVSCIQFWKKCSVFFAILLIPTPYYLRIVVLYLFEYREVTAITLNIITIVNNYSNVKFEKKKWFRSEY